MTKRNKKIKLNIFIKNKINVIYETCNITNDINNI